MPDAVFDDPRLAALYDPLEGDRPDLDVYATLVVEVDASSVLDLGCGTGELACRLALDGLTVIGVDPAAASLDVARRKPGADAVRWLLGDVTTLPPVEVDLALMTGNVAQVFLTDEDWDVTLRGVWRALRPGGRLVFETRDPAREAWTGWTRERTLRRTQVDGVGVVETWVDVTHVDGPFVSFRWTFRFLDTDEVAVSDSTLRFRCRAELEASLASAGFELLEVREAPDRPGAEWVFIAMRPD